MAPPAFRALASQCRQACFLLRLGSKENGVRHAALVPFVDEGRQGSLGFRYLQVQRVICRFTIYLYCLSLQVTQHQLSDVLIKGGRHADGPAASPILVAAILPCTPYIHAEHLGRAGAPKKAAKQILAIPAPADGAGWVGQNLPHSLPSPRVDNRFPSSFDGLAIVT